MTSGTDPMNARLRTEHLHQLRDERRALAKAERFGDPAKVAAALLAVRRRIALLQSLGVRDP